MDDQTLTNTDSFGAEVEKESSVSRLSRRALIQAVAGGVIGTAGIVGADTVHGSETLSKTPFGRLTAVADEDRFTQAEKLIASDASGYELFGRSVSVSPDGTTAVVGAPSVNSRSGAAYIYDLTQTPTETIISASDASTNDRFGFGLSVSVSADGTTILVGAPYEDDIGVTYVYDLTQSPPKETRLTPSDGVPTLNPDLFGWSVSISGDGTTALAGSPQDRDAGFRSGSAYVYDLTQSPPGETKLTASDADARDWFGRTVSINEEGTTALVGAHLADDAAQDSGAAYVYDLTQSSPTETKLTASDAAADDRFGYAVSISPGGGKALVSAIKKDGAATESGSAYVYDLTESPPAETKLIPSNAAEYDRVGDSVSISSDGNTALIGGPWVDAVATQSGQAYVYDLTESPPTETKLIPSDASAIDRFGYSVSISADGDTALMGAPYDEDAGDETGAAYVFVQGIFPYPIKLKNRRTVTPEDIDDDGLYEDLDGDGDVDGQDVALLSQLENAYRKGEVELTDKQVGALDFNDDGMFTKDDISAYTKSYLR